VKYKIKENGIMIVERGVFLKATVLSFGRRGDR